MQVPPFSQGLLQQALQSSVHGFGHIQLKLPMVFMQLPPPSQASGDSHSSISVVQLAPVYPARQSQPVQNMSATPFPQSEESQAVIWKKDHDVAIATSYPASPHVV